MLAPCPACPASPSPTEPGWARGGGWRMGMEGGRGGRACKISPFPSHSTACSHISSSPGEHWGFSLCFLVSAAVPVRAQTGTQVLLTHTSSLCGLCLGEKLLPAEFVFPGAGNSFQEVCDSSPLAWCCTHRGRWIRNSHQEEQGKRN